MATEEPKFRWEPFYDRLMTSNSNILIAGMPGAGKSVIINSLINSILLEESADHSMVLIDLKRVELSQYAHTPHCWEIARTVPEAEAALRHVLSFVEERYITMEKRGEKKYTGTKLHLIIDEMAQLMITSKVCHKLIQEIVQISRAANVQVICATQSPKATVIPTEITMAFDIVIGLHTRNAQDSRNILDVAGCEELPKYGYALIKYDIEPEIKKVQIPMIPEESIKRLIQWRLEGN